MKKYHVLLTMLFCTFTSANMEKNTENNYIEFRGRVKVNVLVNQRQAINHLFGEALGMRIEKQKNFDRVHFNGGGFVAFVYFNDKAMVLEKNDYIKSMQVGLLVPSSQYERLKKVIKNSGGHDMLPNNPQFKDQSKFYYFHVPGNQVFRLVNTPDSELNEFVGLSDDERGYLVSRLENSKQRLVDVLSSISDNQWKYKPNSDTWSIAEIAHHIYKADEVLFERAKILTEGASEPDKKKNLMTRIDFVNDFISEKNRKEVKYPTAPGTEPEVVDEIPWKGVNDFVQDFGSLRNSRIDFVKNTKLDLTDYYFQNIPQLGYMSSYLWLVFMSAHTTRHAAQVTELMEMEAFPDM